MFKDRRYSWLFKVTCVVLFVGVFSASTTATAQSPPTAEERFEAVGPDSPTMRTGGADVNSDMHVAGLLGLFGHIGFRGINSYGGDDDDDSDDDAFEGDDQLDLDPTFGAEAGYEYRIADFLSIGLRARYLSAQSEDSSEFDDPPRLHSFAVMVMPKLRWVTGAALNELYLAVPIGPTYTLPIRDDQIERMDGIRTVGGFNYTISPVVGMVFRTGHNEPGLYLEASWLRHGIIFGMEWDVEDPDTGDVEPIGSEVDGILSQIGLTMGITFSF